MFNMFVSGLCAYAAFVLSLTGIKDTWFLVLLNILFSVANAWVALK